MRSIEEAKLNRNRVTTFLDRDTLWKLLQVHESTLNDMRQDGGFKKKDLKQEEQIIVVLRLLLAEAEDMVHDMDQEDRDRYRSVIDRIDEVSGC